MVALFFLGMGVEKDILIESSAPITDQSSDSTNSQSCSTPDKCMESLENIESHIATSTTISDNHQECYDQGNGDCKKYWNDGAFTTITVAPNSYPVCDGVTTEIDSMGAYCGNPVTTPPKYQVAASQVDCESFYQLYWDYDLGGCYLSSSGLDKQPTIPPQPVSALSEKQKCDTEGGKLDIEPVFSQDQQERIAKIIDTEKSTDHISDKDLIPDNGTYTLTCTQPEKELFKEEI